jgi:rubrerythrin
MKMTPLEWLKSVNIQDPEMICDELAVLDVLTVPHLIRSSEHVKDNIRSIMTRISAKRFDKALEDVEETMGLNSLELSEQCASLKELKSQIDLENMCIASLNKLLSSPIPTRHLTAVDRDKQTKCRVRLTEAKKAHQERAIRLNRIMSSKGGAMQLLRSDTNSDPEIVKQKQSKCLTVSFDEATLMASVGDNHKHLLTSSEDEEEVVRLKELRNGERMRLDALKEQSDYEQLGHNQWECRQCGSGNHESQFKCPSCSARKPAWYDSIPYQFVYQRNHHSRTCTKNQNHPALSAFPSVDASLTTVSTTPASQSPSYFEMIKQCGRTHALPSRRSHVSSAFIAL